MVSIGVLSQLLESHSHLIMRPGESLISSHIQLRLQALQQFSPCTGTAQSASVMRSPQHTTSPWLRSEVTNISKPNPAKQGIRSRLASVSAAVDSQYSFITYRETKEAIFFAIMFSSLLFLWQITSSQYSRRGALLIDQRTSSTNRLYGYFTLLHVLIQQQQSAICGCYDRYMWPSESVDVTLFEKTCKMFVTCSCSRLTTD